MAVYSGKQVADIRTLKRPYSAVNKSGYEISEVQLPPPSIIRTARIEDCCANYMEIPITRSERLLNTLPKMPIAAGPQAYQSQIPSFTSIYGYNASKAENTLVESPQEVAGSTVSGRSGADGAPPFNHLQHKHRDSTSTQTSASTDSSPTTTISTTESSALTDPSPSSSPESPVTILPLSCFSSTGFGVHSLDDLTMTELPIITSDGDRPITSPSTRKPRNAKKLALNLGLQESTAQTSAPPSPLPSFMMPPPMKPRRKPSTLSLQTTTNFSNTSLPSLAMEPPPTPSLRVPQMSQNQIGGGMFSPDPRRGGPVGGMRLPPLERSQISGLSHTFRPIEEITPGGSQEPGREEPSDIRTHLAIRNDGLIGGDSFDKRANQNNPEDSYPNGPILMYAPNVFLYSEPTIEVAAQFDTIFNVASEVENPFDAAQSAKHKQSVEAMDIDRNNIPEPMTAATIDSFRTAFESFPGNSATPTETSPSTPKPVSKRPEYIHLPWEHKAHEGFITDMMAVCEQIDKRVKAGKKVLVHCKQGVSRSATLIIAYGMFRDRSISANEAYERAKERNEYITPNLSLIMELHRFKKLLAPPVEDRKHTRSTMSVDETSFRNLAPQTAPLSVVSQGDPLEEPRSLIHCRGISAPNLRGISGASAPAASPITARPGTAHSREASESTLVNVDAGSPPRESAPLMGTQSEEVAPLMGTPPRLELAGFDLAPPPRRLSPVTGQNGMVTPVAQQQSNHTDVMPSGSQQPATGFSAHRAKRKPTPVMSFRPEQPLRTPPSVPRMNSDAVASQYATAPLDVPGTPGILSPRAQEMVAPSIAPTIGIIGFSSVENSASPAPQAITPRPTAPAAEVDLSSVFSPLQAEFKIAPISEVARPDVPVEVAAARLEIPAEAPVTRPEGRIESRSTRHFFGSIRKFATKKRSFNFSRDEKAQKQAEKEKEKALPALPSITQGNASADVQMGGVAAAGLEKEVDPRSPAMKGESGIVRSIDDVLK